MSITTTPTTATVSSSVARIERPRIDHAALDDQHRARQAHARLFPPGTRVFVSCRLAHRPHPYKPMSRPLQRVPVDAVCRYAGPGLLSVDVYDVESDQTDRVLYHQVTAPDGDLYRVLPDDLRCVEIAPIVAQVPAAIAPVCRALALVETVTNVIRRLAGHIAAVITQAGRGFWTEAGALHLGPHGHHWTLTVTTTGVTITTPDGRSMRYPLRISMSSVYHLVKRLRARFQAAEEARFWRDLSAAVAGLPARRADYLPRCGQTSIYSNDRPRLRIQTETGDGVLMYTHITLEAMADGHRPAWTQCYHFYPNALDLYQHIREMLKA